MKSYEEIAFEVLEAAKARRQQIGKRRRITAISGICAAGVAVIALVVWINKPSERVERAQPVASVQTVTATVTEPVVPETTEPADTMPTRAKETRSTRASTTATAPKYTRSAWEREQVQTDAPESQHEYEHEYEETLPPAPAPFETEVVGTLAPGEGTTPHGQTDVPPAPVLTDAPKPDPEPVVTQAPVPPPLPMPEDDFDE